MTDLDAITLSNDARQGEFLLNAVFKFSGRFVSYPSEAAHIAHVLWCVHTHLMDCWESTPRLAFLSPEPGSGKTRALEITELLVPNAVQTVNVSPAYLFRRVSNEGGATILYDEIDTIFGPKAKESEDIRGFLNAGHRRGASFGRCVITGKNIETVDTPAYAAVALAGLGWLPDTILSRSIVVRMRRRRQDEHVEQYRARLHEGEGRKTFDAIAVWARGNAERLSGSWPELPPEIQDRDADVWEPLIAIADAAGGDWPKRARAAAVELVRAGKERDASIGVRLLADLRTIFGVSEALSTKEILRRLIELDESPWGDIKGRQLDDRGLAQRLRHYGIKSKNLKLDGSVVKGYSSLDLHDAWERYLPALADKSAKSATSAIQANVSGSAVAQVAQLAGNEGGVSRDQCEYCGKYGQTQECHYGRTVVRLHRQCQSAWRVDYEIRSRDGLDNPSLNSNEQPA